MEYEGQSYFDPRVNFVNCLLPHSSILSLVICDCSWTEGEARGNRLFPRKLICCLAECDGSSVACAIRNQTVVQSLICRGYFGRMQLWKFFFTYREWEI